MCVQWCVPVPGVADPDPVDGELDGDELDGDDDVECDDVVDVTDVGDAEPLVAAMATPAAPAPMPAARNAVRIRRRARPMVNVMWLPSFLSMPWQATSGLRSLQHGQRIRRQPEA